MVEQVTVAPEQTETSGPTLEESAKEMGIDVNASAESGGNDLRPGWLPEKFKSPEDLAKAYSELEKRQGQQPQQAQQSSETDESARQAVEQAGVDFDALSDEWANNGELAQDSYDKLEKAGIPRALVDSYIEGQQQIVQQSQARVYESVGGETAYKAMIDWAGDNLSDSEIDAYNQAVNNRDSAAVELAVNGLRARYNTDQGMEPSRIVEGGVSNNSGGSYRSLGELMTDMQSKQYSEDSAFRADVAAKLDRSNILESRRG